MRATDIIRPQASGKPVCGIVRNGDGFFFTVEWNDGRDRAENFFARDTHVIVRIGEDRRLDEITAVHSVALDALPAGDQLRAVIFANIDEGQGFSSCSALFCGPICVA